MDKTNDIMLELVTAFLLTISAFMNQDKKKFINTHSDEKVIVRRLTKDELRDLFIVYFKNETEQDLSSYEIISYIYNVLNSQVVASGNTHAIYNRTYIDKDESKILYHLGEGLIVEIDKNGYRLTNQKEPIFYENKISMTQLEPIAIQKADFSRIDKYLNASDPDSRLLLKIYLVSTLIQNIPRFGLFLTGTHGSSKTTLLKMFKKIIDPTVSGVQQFPSKTDDLVLSLSQQYYAAYDNQSFLDQENSDILCQFITGSNYTKRKLFTDEDQTIIRLFGNVAINGINLVATKPDLLSRSLLIDLDPIEESKRLSEKELWASFDSDLPYILGGIFKTLSIALQKKKSLKKMDKTYRMADAVEWGRAIAVALGYTENEFIEALDHNIQALNEKAIDENSLASVVINFMAGKNIASASPTRWFEDLKNEAIKHKIDIRNLSWLKAPNYLSRELKVLQPTLKRAGILVEHKRSNKERFIEIRKIDTPNNEKALIDEQDHDSDDDDLYFK